MPAIYNDPIGGNPSTVGPQIRTDYYQKRALIEIRKEQYFSQLADTTNLPKNIGKTIKRFHYLPILDDANINDQGIDAAGLSATLEKTIVILMPEVANTGNGFVAYYAVGEGANSGAATTAAELAANDIFTAKGVFNTDYATTKAAIEALTPPWSVDDTIPVVPNSGNLYGSSKDVGTIAGKLPLLNEMGGAVNHVTGTRIELTGSIEKFGFYDSYSKESLDFDTDSERLMHINREMLNAANEITEDTLQIDLLNSAGVLRYGGDATTTSEINGETGTESLITYEDLMRMSIDLDDNRTPKHTTVITGSRMIDTKVIGSARFLYIGSELVPLVQRMVDLFGKQAFIPVEHYAHANTVKGDPNTINGEIGSLGQFRIVVVPEMMHWAGAGAASTVANAGYRTSGGNYNVYPMLCVGDKSFMTIGFQTDGKSVKFNIIHKKPGKEIADLQNPYGEQGFMSIKWYYGFMLLRPERIALAKTIAEY